MIILIALSQEFKRNGWNRPKHLRGIGSQAIARVIEFLDFSVQYNRFVDEKLADKPQLHHFFRRCMLWRFIPTLVWGMRKNTMGNFGEFDKENVMRILKTAYGDDVFFILFVTPIVRFIVQSFSPNTISHLAGLVAGVQENFNHPQN